MNNKRGQLQLYGLGILIALVLIFLGFFYFSTEFRLVTIGAGLIIMGFVVFMKKDLISKENIRLSVFALLMGAGLIMILSTGLLQSVFSVSQVNFDNGKAYWVFTGSASSTQESIAFVNKPSSATDPSTGIKFTPQETMRLSIFKSKSDCVYQATKIDSNTYSLGAFQRDAKVYVIDNYGQEATLNMISDSKTFTKVGSLTVKTQGGLISNSDCQSGLSTVIVVDKNNIPHYYDKASWETARKTTSLFDLLVCASGFSCPKVQEATGFLEQFKSAPSFNGNEVRGEVNFANIVYTITADADYFKSVVFTPAKASKPNIVSVDYQKSIETSDTSSAVVKVRNDGETGEMNLKAEVTSSSSSITPTFYSETISAGSTKSFNFKLKVPSAVQSGNVKFTACGVSQIASVSCDTETITFNVVDSTPSAYCGDGKCQSNEDATTCSADCNLPEVPTETGGDLTCGTGQTLKKSQEIEYSWYNYLGIGDGEKITTQKCVTSSWVIYSGMGAIVIILGGWVIYLNKGRRKRR